MSVDNKLLIVAETLASMATVAERRSESLRDGPDNKSINITEVYLSVN